MQLTGVLLISENDFCTNLDFFMSKAFPYIFYAFTLNRFSSEPQLIYLRGLDGTSCLRSNIECTLATNPLTRQ